MNRCIKCGEVKSWNMFNRNHRMKSGRVNTCKPCAYAYTAWYKKLNRKRVTAQEKLHRAAFPEKHRARGRKYRQQNPDKSSCHTQVWRALLKGELERGICKCGSENVEAHHEDYVKPLEVVWMCRPCHINYHMKDRKMIERHGTG